MTEIALPPPFVHPFSQIADALQPATAFRQRITAAYRLREDAAIPALVAEARMTPERNARVDALARQLAERLRNRRSAAGRAGLVQGLLQEYALSSQEGVALMCLAEALLRIPDAGTRDALIRDKIADGQWEAHAGRSPSVFVNAATWGLLLTGKLVATHSETGLSRTLTRLIGKGGEPLIRKGVDLAMRMMGEQFVTGESILEALENARRQEALGFRYSYDMLGEAALTAFDARRYRASYEQAIHAIGKASQGRGVYEGPGISIKLSALHPRYSRAQHGRVMDELYPVLRDLTLLARRYDIGLNIDAEEADRLELSLDLLERLCFEPALARWNGIGFVIQAYQKRCPATIDHVVDLARRSGHRLMVRLVKGAYWDSEIKRAQLEGLEDYPVYTRKVYTDVSYLACARRLLAAPDQIYPQFATHNAHTMAAIYELAEPADYTVDQYEFQCLHGMGEPLYEQVVGDRAAGKLGRPCRIYAPVGTHETLLAYLVRRLLENGANTSFVNRIADPAIAIATLVEDPVAAVERLGMQEGRTGLPHVAIPLPVDLYGLARKNSPGLDLSNDDSLRNLSETLRRETVNEWRAEPMIDGSRDVPGAAIPLRNPADHRDLVGEVIEATVRDVDRAITAAARFAPAWADTLPADRADCLDRAAQSLEQQMPQLLGLLSREAGKTFANGIAEVREAVDFLRFYAAQAREHFTVESHRPLGPVACISPWNFPLAIFVGQIAAALAAGNPALAKPAEQTPLVAAQAVRLLWEGGVPRAALQLLPGRGETVGRALTADPRIQGVMFTGSTDVARILQRTLSERLTPGGQPVPLIAETGGQNAMIVDSSALVEQVVIDVLASAFDSAGQRCSALRVLCVQEDIADRVIEMLKGAMAEMRIGDPAMLAVDVGPVIDADARESIERHVAAMQMRGRKVFREARDVDRATTHGTFVMPTLIELERIAELDREIFGPVLHVVRFRRQDLDALLGQINGTGYGLTLGVHTRIDETITKVVEQVHAGNVYVNRNIVGAVVGVQPFGGEGLSGTGPKAGGPLYMFRMLAARPDSVLVDAMASAGPADASEPTEEPGSELLDPLASLEHWLRHEGNEALARRCAALRALSRSGHARTLVGPTGERNVYSLRAREAVLCLPADIDDALIQLAAVLAVGSRAVWEGGGFAEALLARLPVDVRQRITVARDWRSPTVSFDAVLHHGEARSLREAAGVLSARKGPIVGMRVLSSRSKELPLEALVVERALSINTAAAGGNASLMTIG
ncbi:fused DNA-binding transcriptional regulator; proline dehydrogenase; pyrroline-5-carboxylate dehydrogenase [Burkholderiales bacterium 8X]|nr:fused DNA-binding transcriptional regulator; proline dehydrogenase; pyrroline-5-carboxylate dehydrogenase [Burkholderiales bacterium 8X]